jgi:hypothetical protein
MNVNTKRNVSHIEIIHTSEHKKAIKATAEFIDGLDNNFTRNSISLTGK